MRLAVILETLAGHQSVTEACGLLGIGERHFHSLRLQVLQHMLQGLEPRALGRPGRPRQIEPAAIAAMQEELRTARIDLQAAQIREEIALAMPQLFHRQARKKAHRKTRRRRHNGNGTKRNT